MIGGGIYLLPASLGAFGSISILGWGIGSLGAALLGGVFGWLAILRPQSDGLFGYVREALGPRVGFVIAVLCWFPISMAPAVMGVTGYLSVFLPVLARPPAATLATIAFLWLMIGANYVGPRFVARLGGWTLFVGMAPELRAVRAQIRRDHVPCLHRHRNGERHCPSPVIRPGMCPLRPLAGSRSLRSSTCRRVQ